MSNSVSSVLDDVMGGESFYDPSEDKPNVIVPEGDFYAHVKDYTVKEDVVIRGKHLADIYNLTFKLAEENSDKDFGEHSGSVFVGKTIRSKGFFRFKKPDKTTHPNLEENSGSNKSYMELIQSFGIVSEPDSEGRYFLPNVNESDVVGMPVEIEVKHNEWTNSEGEKVKTPKAVAIFRWEGQAKKDLTEDLPF